MPEPSELPTWSTNGGTRVKPISGAILTGFLYGQRPPPKWFNWLFGMICEWIAWLNDEKNKALSAGYWQGYVSTGGTTGESEMMTLVHHNHHGEADQLPTLVDFDSDGTPQENKLLRLPSGGAYLVSFEYSGLLVHSETGETGIGSLIMMQSSFTDGFVSSLVETASEAFTIANSEQTHVKHTMSKIVDTHFGAVYLRWLFQLPAGKLYPSGVSSVSVVWLGKS